jgi:hypothetical protein
MMLSHGEISNWPGLLGKQRSPNFARQWRPFLSWQVPINKRIWGRWEPGDQIWHRSVRNAAEVESEDLRPGEVRFAGGSEKASGRVMRAVGLVHARLRLFRIPAKAGTTIRRLGERERWVKMVFPTWKQRGRGVGSPERAEARTTYYPVGCPEPRSEFRNAKCELHAVILCLESWAVSV